MKNARIIAVLVLLTLSLSGCANAKRAEVSVPSSQETVTTEPVQSTVPQENTTVSVSESTEIPAENTAELETEKTLPEVSTAAKEETPPTVKSLRKHNRRNLNRPTKKNPQNQRLTFRLGSTMPKPMPKA